ncbi:hypothetical protein Pr1d_29220 [Bythopirellula goksoeyrii]|uniref:Uncharacterized protein n=1 Tax=Bythopirellula goksoeyrii TaxID=1400387 RepID=A0A5B9QDB8_9BACT|nr:hypothetical protein Pr1d_29220 [Bythopirellula goksoeyrii]
MNRIGFPALCCLFLFFTANRALAEKVPNPAQNQIIAKTARLYLESSGTYVPGDLITESQIEELQDYLRRSFGNSPATHRGLSNRALKDDAPLSRYFFREQANQVLRKAAEKLGGYGQLEVLSLNRQGRQVLQEAIATQSEAGIISRIDTSPQNMGSEASGNPHQLKAIYTLEDFLEAAFPKSGEENSLDP